MQFQIAVSRRHTVDSSWRNDCNFQNIGRVSACSEDRLVDIAIHCIIWERNDGLNILHIIINSLTAFAIGAVFLVKRGEYARPASMEPINRSIWRMPLDCSFGNGLRSRNVVCSVGSI